MSKERSKKKGIIPWFRRIIEPHGHRRKSSSAGVSRLIRHTGDRFVDDECCRWGGCCICILMILLIFFGGFFGGTMSGYDTTVPTEPDEDTAAYYQMRVSISATDEEYYLADDALFIGDLVFDVVIYAVAGGVADYDIEGFTATETIIGESAYDYKIDTLLYVEIYNEEFEFFGSDYVTSGTMDIINISHLENLGVTIFVANISWLMNGAGNRFSIGD